MPAYYYPAAVVAPAVPCVTPTAVGVGSTLPPPVIAPPTTTPQVDSGFDSGLLGLYKNYQDPTSVNKQRKLVTDANAKDLYGPIAQHFESPDAACSNHGIIVELRPNGRFICWCDLGWTSEDCSVPLKNWGAFRKCSSNKPGQCDEGMQCATWSLVDLGEVNRCVCTPDSVHPACKPDDGSSQFTGNLRCGGDNGCPAGLECKGFGSYCGCPKASSSNPLCQCAGRIPDPSNYTLVQCMASDLTECRAVSADEGQEDACNAYLPKHITQEAFAPGMTSVECDEKIENDVDDNKKCVNKLVLNNTPAKKKTTKQ